MAALYGDKFIPPSRNQNGEIMTLYFYTTAKPAAGNSEYLTCWVGREKVGSLSRAIWKEVTKTEG